MQGTGRSPAVGPVLDHLTTRSTLHRALERVAGNGGCRGTDGVTLGVFRCDRERELDSLLTRRYPLPLLESTIPRKTGGKCLLKIPPGRDRVVQSAVYLLTRDRFEAGLKFLGVIFLGEAICKPFTTGGEKGSSHNLPPPLDLRRHLELRHPPVVPGRRPP